MLFEEWEKGTGSSDNEEYKLAEKFYMAMPEGFTKEKLFEIRNAMDEQDFRFMCELVVGCDLKVKEAQDNYKYYMDKAVFLGNVVETLKDEGKIDCIATYASLEADKAMKRQKELILSMWDELQ